MTKTTTIKFWCGAVALVLTTTNCTCYTPPPMPPVPGGTWQVLAQGLPEALLSVTGSSSSDVWAVGADLGRGPLVLHFDGTSWARRETGHTGHLWWVHEFDDGTLMAGGARGAIVRFDGTRFSELPTPGLGRDTVFGLWGSSPTDVFAVGGFAGRSGFIWHFDGTGWARLVLPADIPKQADGDIPGFFKVWGDRAGHVWVVGGHGLILRSDDGAHFKVVPSGVTSTLFTVTGTVDAAGAMASVVAVGGFSDGVLLEASADGAFVDHSPMGASLIQGVGVLANGSGWASGQNGALYRRRNGQWALADDAPTVPAASLHSTWVDPGGGVWAVGGNVLDPSLSKGALVHFGAQLATFAEPAPDGGVDAGTPAPVCPAAGIDPFPTGSIARRWNEQLLNAIRRDVPRPPVHARNLFHWSAAAWDAWATYDTVADGVFFNERHTAADVGAARQEAISYASFRLLSYRYDASRAARLGAGVSQACFRALMAKLGYDPDDTVSTGDSPRAVGNRVAAAVIALNTADGANETNNYADTTGWMPRNPPLVLDEPGVSLPFPSYWQQLNLFEAVTQNGLVLPSGLQGYIGAAAGEVKPFALGARQSDGLYLDAGVVPTFASPEMKAWVVGVIAGQAALEVNATTLDISPGGYGNNSLGANDGTGHPVNPVTDAGYAPNVVPRGDFTRVLAEFWADGPNSETPPGHWDTLANYVADHPLHQRQLYGTGPVVSALEWDVKSYLTVNGATHDAAIVSWGLKRKFSAPRPLSLIRHMAGLGQSSEPSSPGYHADGLPLVPGLIELITAESSAVGQRHQHLANFVGQVAIFAWPGEPGDRATRTTPVQWIRGIDWAPYQRRTFVTPAFPGYTSGHSTFSRAAAEALTAITGSPYFPGGLGEYLAPAKAYLVFEDGPTVDVRLQWATYFDAADQAGQSRVYGGIHLVADDFAGRRMGSQIGQLAAARARQFFDGTAVP